MKTKALLCVVTLNRSIFSILSNLLLLLFYVFHFRIMYSLWNLFNISYVPTTWILLLCSKKNEQWSECTVFICRFENKHTTTHKTHIHKQTNHQISRLFKIYSWDTKERIPCAFWFVDIPRASSVPRSNVGAANTTNCILVNGCI